MYISCCITTLKQVYNCNSIAVFLSKPQVLNISSLVCSHLDIRTWVSPVYQAPYAVMKLIRFFCNHKHTQQLSPTYHLDMF